MKRAIKEWAFREWYRYVSKTDKNAEVLFMNYGYQDENEKVELSEADSKNRYSIQLYHKTASFGDLTDKKILEVGCGRGGGLSYIHKAFHANETIGLDLNQRAVDFCNSFYKQKGLSFTQGDAQNLPFENESFDVVLNVESSHRYPDFAAFLKEAYRVLKPDSYLLLSDFRFNYDMDTFLDTVKNSDFETVHSQIITPQVLDALRADDGRKRELVKRLIPRMIRKTALNFAGAIDSETYKRFENGGYVYFLYVLKKNTK